MSYLTILKQRSFHWYSIIMICLLINGCNKSPDIEIINHSGQLKILKIIGEDLSPAYEISKRHYVSTAANSVSTIGLSASIKSEDGKVFVNGQSLVGMNNFNLAVGNNIFTIIVINSQGLQDEYHLTVTRLIEES